MHWFSRILVSLVCLCHVAYGRTLPCPGEGGISVEWLVAFASIEDPEFAILQEGDATIIPNDQSWHSGYRIDVIYNFSLCPVDFLFRWTHFPTFSDSRTVSGSVTNLITQSDGESASVKEEFNVHYLDFLLGGRLINGCPFLITFQGGVQYARIRFQESSSVNIENSSSVFRNRSRLLWGVGPEIGADFSFNFWRCFGFTARGYGSLLISKRIARLDLENPDAMIIPTTSNQNYVGVIPFVNARIGVNYSHPFDSSYWACLRAFNLDIEVGYETSWFFNSVARIQPFADTASEIVKWMPFALQGPYVHVGIAF